MEINVMQCLRGIPAWVGEKCRRRIQWLKSLSTFLVVVLNFSLLVSLGAAGSFSSAGSLAAARDLHTAASAEYACHHSQAS